MREKSFAKGEIIFREGEEGTEAYRILEGRIEISILIEGQGEAPLGTLLNGQPIGTEAEHMVLPLSQGENHLTLGVEGSSFQFTILLEPPAAS